MKKEPQRKKVPKDLAKAPRVPFRYNPNAPVEKQLEGFLSWLIQENGVLGAFIADSQGLPIVSSNTPDYFVESTGPLSQTLNQLISNTVSQVGAELPAEKLEIAMKLFRFMGNGRLEILADETGGKASGEYLHYSYCWQEKYGKSVKRMHALNTFAAGYTAAVEVAFATARESVEAKEVECLGLKDPGCKFKINPASSTGDTHPFVDQEACLRAYRDTQGLNEEKIRNIAEGLRNFTADVEGDERGLVQAFGVFIAMHLPGYYNRISYDAEILLRERAKDSLEVYRSLLRESGHVCVFNTFGGLLLSAEWEGLIGLPSGDVEELVTYCAAIGRSLGFGHWTIQELVPGKRLVLITPNSYESAFYLHRYGQTDEPNNYFVQGAALAMMVLSHKLNWDDPPELNQKVYNALFHGGLGWKVEEVGSLSAGSELTEVVVTRDD